MVVKDRDYDDKRDEPTKPLDQDFDSPFSEPNDAKHRLPPSHPTTDSKADNQEVYDEGADGAFSDNGPYKDRPSSDQPRKLF